MFYSPLRYPGGKGKLASFMEMVVKQTGHEGGIYIEPFAGGAGIALELLEKKVVSDIVINDYDKRIYSFWRAILTETDRFINEVYDAPINIEEWDRQRHICLHEDSKYSFELGFATFYMNRTNRSGIIKGGIIGGRNQSGGWKMDARFNKEDLIHRIEKVAKNKNAIHLYNKDIESFILNYLPKYENNALIYFDPPYFNKGKQLYLNYFNYEDHKRIRKMIQDRVNCDWVITYDDVPEIADLYCEHKLKRYDLNYSVASKRKASEIIVFSDDIRIPSTSELDVCSIGINIR